jgi:hypothetical protein
VAIEAVCSCGKKFRAKDDYAGRRAICPACHREFTFQEKQAPLSHDKPGPPPLPPGMTEAEKPKSDGSGETRRSFWRDPIIVVGAAVSTLILLAFFGYLAWPRVRSVVNRKAVATQAPSASTDYRDVLLKIEMRPLQLKENRSGISKKEKELTHRLMQSYVDAAKALPPGDDGLYLLVDGTDYFGGDLFGMWFVSKSVSQDLARQGTTREPIKVLKDMVSIAKAISPQAPERKFESSTISFWYQHVWKSQKEEEWTEAEVINRVIDELRKPGRSLQAL